MPPRFDIALCLTGCAAVSAVWAACAPRKLSAGAFVFKPSDWILLAMLACAVLLGCIQASALAKKMFADDGCAQMFFYAAAYQAMLFAAVVFFRRFCVARVDFGFKPGLRALAAGAAWALPSFLILAAISAAVSFLTQYFTGGLPRPQYIILQLKNCGSPAVLAVAVFSIVVFAPVCEELLFRGLIYRTAKGFFAENSAAGARFAAVLTAAIFALAHGSAFAFVQLWAVSLILTSLYERSGNIFSCMVCHGAFNALNVACIVFLPANEYI